MHQDFRSVLAGFKQPHDVDHLRALEDAITSLNGQALDAEDIRSVFNLFERFPEEDGYGIFWSFLHAVEATEGYECDLLASVSRSPGEFNVMMIGRLLNAGISVAAGQSLRSILEGVAAGTGLPVGAVSTATAFLSRDAASEASRLRIDRVNPPSIE